MESSPQRTAWVLLARSLDVLWFALLAAGAAAEGVLIVVLIRGGHPHLDLPVPISIRGRPTVAGQPGLAAVTGAGGQLSIPAPAGVIAAGLAVAAAGLALLLVLLRQIRKLVADALAGSPFGAHSAHRVRLIGLAVIAAELGRGFVVLASSWWARANVHAPGFAIRVAFPVNLAIVGAGVLMLVLAEVFRIGAALQQDHDLTV